MADGDNATSSIQKSSLLDRDWALKGSYFFKDQVLKCLAEQSKVFRSKLAEKENEAQISYDKSLSDHFGSDAQIDSVFIQLLFDSDAPMNFDDIIDDLRSLAGRESRGKAVTRLLDLLFVTRNTGELSKELEIRQASYDLRSEEETGDYGAMKIFTKLMSQAGINRHRDRSAQMSLVLSMIATGKPEIVAAALITLANVLYCPWDALVLARFFYGQDHEVTKMLQEAWTEAVMTDEHFRMIKITRSLGNCNLKDVAQDLMDGINNKKAQSAADLFDAYRCLAVAMAANPTLSEFEMKLEVADVSKLMMNIYVTALGWGRTTWARMMIADISKRAPPAGIPSDICQIGLRCHIELVDLLHKSQGLGPDEQSIQPIQEEGMLKTLALQWRGQINREGGEMSKLKTKDAGRKKIMDDWIVTLSHTLRSPFFEEWSELNKKMECVFLAAEFFPQMIRWAATGEDGEPLRVIWPEPQLSFTIEDESIVPAELVTGPRSRSISITSSRSAATTKDEGKKQKKKGEAKEEQRPSGPAQDKTQTAQRTEANQQHQESAVPALKPRDFTVLQSNTPTRYASHPQYNQSGGGVVHGHANQFSKDNGRWTEGGAPLTQDVRRSAQYSGERRELSGGNTQHNAPASHVSPKAVHAGSPRGGLAPSPHGGQSIGSPFRRPTTSPSASDHDLAAKIDQYCDADVLNPAVAHLLEQKKQELLAAQSNAVALSTPTEQQQPVSGALSEVRKQQKEQSQTTTPQPSSPVPSRPKSIPEDVTAEMIQSKLAETLAKSAAAAAETKAAQQTTSGQQSPPASPPSQHALPQQPTMGTAAAKEVRARRSMESVQSVEQTSESSELQPVQQSQSEPQLTQSEQQQQQPMQPPLADSQYEELMGQMEQKDGDGDRSYAPDPAEMNKLFTGTNKGQATLPPFMLAEQAADAAAAAALAAALPPPVPALVAVAAESVAAPSQSSQNLTKLTPSEGLVLPPGDGQNMQTYYASSSDQGMLTPITEASQETFGTKSQALSESDAPGLSEEMPDNVFEEVGEKNQVNQTPVPVNVGAQLPLRPNLRLYSEEMREFGTPNASNLCSDNEEEMSFSPNGNQQSSPMQTASSSATDRSEQTTVVPTTSHEMGVRSEAQDANQLHQSILTPVPPAAEAVQHSSPAASVETMGGGANEVAFIPTISVMEQSGHETAQAQTVVHPELAAPAAPTMQPLQQQAALPQMTQPQMPAVSIYTPLPPSQPVPPPVEMTPAQQYHHIQTAMQQQPQQTAPPITSIWSPATPPSATPVEMSPVQQQCQQMEQQQQQQQQQHTSPPQMTQSPMPAVTMASPVSSSQPVPPPVVMPPAAQQQYQPIQMSMQQQAQRPTMQQAQPPVQMPPVQPYQQVQTPMQQQPQQSLEQQQQTALPQMTQSPMPAVSVYAPVSSPQSLPPPPMTPAEAAPHYQQVQMPMQQQPQQQIMQQAQYVPPPPVTHVGMPSAQQYQQIQTTPMQQTQPSVAPTQVESVATQPSQSATSQQSMNSQYSSPSHEQYQQQPVYQTQTPPMAAMQQQQQANQPAPMPVSTGQQQSVDCGEVKELVTSCGIPYKYSPVKNGQVDQTVASLGVEAVQQQQAMQESIQPPSFLDSIIGGEVFNSNQNSMSSMSNTQTGTITAAEIDEHAAARRQEASEYGGAASEIGSSSAPHPFPESNSYSMPPSMPSTAMTTPDINEQQFDYNSGGGAEWAMTENQDNQYGDQGSAHSYSTTSVMNVNSQQQPAFNQVQQTQQPLATADSAPQQTQNIPLYVNPFEQTQREPQPPQKFIMQQQPHHNMQQQQQQSGGGFGDMNTGGTPAPCFGTFSNSDQNVHHQPDGGFGGHVQSQNYGHSGDHGNQNRSFRGQGGQGGTRGEGRGRGGSRGGSEYGRGGRGRGDRPRGGGGGSFGTVPSGFSQDARGGNNQQQPSGHGQSGAGFEGGDSGHQKSFQQQNQGGSFGGHGTGFKGRGGSGGATAGASGAGRGNRGFTG